jgi:hypothetical protein
LTPYSREAETKTMSLLDAALLEKHDRSCLKCHPAAAASWPQKMFMNCFRIWKGVQRNTRAMPPLCLEKRAATESKAMREILEQQQKHIEGTIDRHDRSPQLTLNFPDEEKRQLESNRRYWNQRLIALLQSELTSEPERIRALYEVRAKRIEPVGLVYLWPTSR